MQQEHGLLAERIGWRKRFDGGYKPWFLEEYLKNRESELWRSTRIVEQLAEYILWLEAKHERSTD